MRSIYFLLLCMFFTNLAHCIEVYNFGRWVNFGVKGGQPQGGVVCTPLTPDGDDYVLCTGDITGIRASWNHGKRWFCLNNPIETAYKDPHGFYNICIDYESWLNPDISDIVYYFSTKNLFANLRRSTDGGRTWAEVEGPDVSLGSEHRQTPMTVEPYTGKGYIATYDGTTCKLYKFARTGNAVEHSKPNGSSSLIYDVAGVDSGRAIITTKTGVYTADFNESYSLKKSMLDGGFMYVNPEYPDIVWVTLTEEKDLLKSINGGDSFTTVNNDLPFTPGKIAVYGGDSSGNNAKIIICKRDSSTNPYIVAAFRPDIIYSANGGVSFSTSSIEATGSVNYPIQSAGDALMQMSATPTANDDGIFYIARFGGLMISENGGMDFIWSLTGIYGLRTFDIASVNNDDELWVGHNDHGLFKSDIGTSGDSWYNLCYNNWDQKTDSWGGKGMCDTIFPDPRNDNKAYYVLSAAYYADTGKWYLESIDNNTRTSLFDYLDFDSSLRYGFSCTMDIHELLENDNVVFYAGLRGYNGSTNQGVIKIFKNGDNWDYAYLNNGLSGDARKVYDIQSDFYGNLYIRTESGLYRKGPEQDDWLQRITHGAVNSFWCRRSLSFDKYDASKVYYGYFEKIYHSTDFGQTFSLLYTMPKSPENPAKYVMANRILVENNIMYIGSKGYTNFYGSGGILIKNMNDGSDFKWMDRYGMPKEGNEGRAIIDKHGRLLTSSTGSSLIRYELIIDNEDTDTTKPYYYSEINDNFEDSLTTDENMEFGCEVRNPGTSRHFTFSGSGGSAAYFNFKVPETGVYTVYARWNIVVGKTMKDDATYYLMENGTLKAIKYCDQRVTSSAKKWNKLYDYNFNAAESYRVELRHYYGTNETINADAIRVEKFAGTIIIDNEMTNTVEDNNFTQTNLTKVSHSTSPWTYAYGPQINKRASSYQKICQGGTAQGQWNFKVPITGKYKVYAWWAKGPDWQKTDVKYRIYYDGGNVLCDAVNQKQDQAKWNLLENGANTSFYFKKDISYKVMLREIDQTSGSHFSADAVMLELISL